MLDVLTINRNSQDISVLRGKGDGTFFEQVRTPENNEPHTVVVIDLNGDPSPDLAVAGNNVALYVGLGNGRFEVSENSVPGGGRSRSIVSVDVDSDGALDLVTSNSSSEDISVFFGNGDGTFRPSIRSPTGGGVPRAILSADFDDDSNPDIATANESGIWVILGVGDGTFVNPRRFSPGEQPHSIVTADFNKDGFADIAAAPSSSSFGGVLLGKGDGSFEEPILFLTGTGPGHLGVADLDQDGTLDLAVTNGGSDDVTILLGVGDGSMESFQTVADVTALLSYLFLGGLSPAEPFARCGDHVSSVLTCESFDACAP